MKTLKSQKTKDLYRDSLQVKLSKSADARVWSNIEAELEKQSKKKGAWLQLSLAASVVCALLVVVIMRNSPSAPSQSGAELAASEIDQITDVTLEIDEGLASTQILAYEDYEDMGIGSEYEY